MSDERYLTLRQADQLRTDIANLESGLEPTFARFRRRCPAVPPS
jgi:hypothetical protein